MAPTRTLIVLISTYILSIQNINAQFNANTSSCQPKEPCTIDCSEIECDNRTITCPIDNTCTIECNEDEFDCDELTINATFTTSLTINGCVGNETCSDLNIICPDSSDPKSCDGEKCKDICINDPQKGIYHIVHVVYTLFHVLVNSTFFLMHNQRQSNMSIYSKPNKLSLMNMFTSINNSY